MKNCNIKIGAARFGKRGLLVLILFFLSGTLLFGADFSFTLDVAPQGFVPSGQSTELFSLGGGAALGATFDFSSPWYLKTGLSYLYMPTHGTIPLNLIAGSAGGGLRFDMGTLFTLRLGLFAGGFVGLYDSLIAYNPLAGAEAGLQVNLGGGFRLGLSGGYDYYVGTILTEPDFSALSLLEGFNFSVGAYFVPVAGSGKDRRPRMEIESPIFQSVFPVFYQYYNENPLGMVRITNKEKRAVQNVRVSLMVNQYMEAPKQSIVLEKMGRGESVDVPILALFRNSILGVTEGTTVSAQIIVEYEDGGEHLSVSRTETLRILNRNNITWDDDRKAAAFVTANDPTVQRFARNITAAIRGESVTAVNERLRIAMAIFQALNIYGIEYVIDPDSSYIELSQDVSALDSIQFPQQTLDFKAGDCDDLTVLYCALLESVGIRTAFITVPGHIYAAFALDMDEAEAAKTFSRPEELIVLDKEVWVPIEITLVKKDFLEAWTSGAKQWNENEPSGQAQIFIIRDAWRLYAPTGFASEALAIDLPQTTVVVPNYTALLRRFIDREIGPQVSDLRNRISASRGNQQLINRLGTLYARYGLYEEAEKEFLAAVRASEYLPSLLNLGNIYLLKNDLRTALRFLERARAVRRDNPRVLITLARLHFDLSDYSQASQRYREAEILAPEIVREFSYIVNENRDAARASAAQNRGRVIWDEE